MAGIFISYRRDDTPGDARGIYEGLAGRFGRANVFMDIDNLLAGQRFDRELAQALARCDVLIAVIGPRWMDLLAARTGGGDRDYVREEIAAALKRNIIVIPVRAGREGRMPALPRAAELPDDIRELVLHQKHDVAHETFRRDLADLMDAIRRVQRGQRQPVTRKAIAFVLAAVLLLGGGLALFQSGMLKRAVAPISGVQEANEAIAKKKAEDAEAEKLAEEKRKLTQDIPIAAKSLPPTDIETPERKQPSSSPASRSWLENLLGP